MLTELPQSKTGLRPITIQTPCNNYAEGSVLIGTGNTRVMCTVSLQTSVPRFLRGTGSGWITAEYAMLPRATHERTNRETRGQRGRSQEIQRLIGRSLRQCVNMQAIGERQYIADCDVMQADGGTRVASITGAAIALHQALAATLPGFEKAWRGWVCGVAVAYVGGDIRVDPDYALDSNADADMNLVVSEKGELIEVQVTAEKSPLPRDVYDAMLEAGIAASKELIDLQKRCIGD